MASQMISPQTMRWSVAESFLHRGEPFTEDTQPFPEFAPEDYSGDGGETMCLDDLLWQDSRNISLVSLNLCTIEMDCTFGTTAEQQEGDAAGSTGAYADGVGKDGNNNSLVWCVAGGVRLHACTLIGARHGALVSCTMRDALRGASLADSFVKCLLTTAARGFGAPPVSKLGSGGKSKQRSSGSSASALSSYMAVPCRD